MDGSSPPSSARTKSELNDPESETALGGADAVRPEQLRPRPPRQPAQGPTRDVQQPPGHLQHARAAATCSQQDGEQLGGRQRGGAQRPEALARAVGRAESGDGREHPDKVGCPTVGRRAITLLSAMNLRRSGGQGQRLGE